MSIWSSFASIDDLYDGDYGDEQDCLSTLDLATTGLRERGDRIRFWVDMPTQGEEVTVVLHRDQIIVLRNALNEWLGE
jgi:hypothetical protein